MSKRQVRWWEVRWWLSRKREDLMRAFVWHLPKWLIQWASIRLIAHATMGPYGNTDPNTLTAIKALERWGSHL